MVYLDPQIMARQLEFNGLVSYSLEWIKNHPRISFINCDSKTLNRIIGIVSSGLIALGISYKYSYDAALDGGTFVIALSHIGMDSLWNGFMQWVLSFLSQQFIYKNVVKERVSAA